MLSNARIRNLWLLICIVALVGVPVFLAVRSKLGNPPHIVLIVIDTVRHDHLSCYGHHRRTTPYLETLLPESVLFTRAYSTSGWTPPAHASLFTGLFPATHHTTQENWVMALDLNTVAEVLEAEGYETVGISENPLVSKAANFDQGFSHYHEAWRGKASRGGENPAYLYFKSMLAGRDPEKPLFVFVNLMAPHSPYNSSPQFKDTFVRDRSLTCEANRWRDYFVREVVFTPDEIEHLRELYDGEILYSDFLIREMFKELKRAGMWEETVVIITSDHGENIGHHDMMDHVFSLYESTIHVPLIIRIPNGRSRGVQDSRLVQLTDLFPTMLALARLDCREYPSQGTDLFAFGEAVREEILCEYYYPVQVLQCYDEARREHPLLEPYKRRIRCLIQDSKKLIWGSDGRNEFYDLSQDPHEVDNLIHDAGYADDIDGMTERLQALIAQYASVRADAPPADASDLDDETRERLRSLGYTQ